MTYSILNLDGHPARFVDLPRILGDNIRRFPWLIRIVMENTIRNSKCDAQEVCAPFLDWLANRRSAAEVAFYPNRILMHDTTCLPALVDIAAMRDKIAEAGRDPGILNPVLPVDVSVDHSVAVDRYGNPDALSFNMSKEIERNAERYRLVKWATQTFENIKVHPPGTGIMHTINLEQLATVVAVKNIDGVDWIIPDTLIGTDSHTPMINGIGVLAWGVGGIEAESVMFGMPVMLRIPEVIGVRLTGTLSEGVLSTDLALTVTERLRKYGVSGQFVEFFGPGVSSLSAGDRSVVANMAPEYGASSGYFPIDEQTIRYLKATGRSKQLQNRVEELARRQGLWFDPEVSPLYTDVIEIDLNQIVTSIAGPKRPQDRLSPDMTREALQQLFKRALRSDTIPTKADNADLPDGAVAIAAITSCTNTSDPRLLIAAGLLARKARKLGLRPPPWVKTSLAPGSPAASLYLTRSGLLEDLSDLGFDIVGFGCTTCIGNSGPLEASMARAIQAGTAATAILSGNRNFSERVHPQLEAAFLTSPPMVVAYALAGDACRNIMSDPIGFTSEGQPVFLRDIWPDGSEIDDATKLATNPEDFGEAFVRAADSVTWRELEAPAAPLFPWDKASTYVRRPPFAAQNQPSRLGRYQAKPLLVLGDDITTDHISPAGQISADSEAGRYLVSHGADPSELNVFAARRSNWEVMLRGVYTNRGVRNLLDEKVSSGSTIHASSGKIMPLWQAAERYQSEGVSLIVVAGERYGTGSSRDWAAKGVSLLGVRAILAKSFERIHRSNLVGMGILPLILPSVLHPSSMTLSVSDTIEVNADAETMRPGIPVSVRIMRAGGEVETFETTAAVETMLEVTILEAGGVIPFILDKALRATSFHG